MCHLAQWLVGVYFTFCNAKTIDLLHDGVFFPVNGSNCAQVSERRSVSAQDFVKFRILGKGAQVRNFMAAKAKRNPSSAILMYAVAVTLFLCVSG